MAKYDPLRDLLSQAAPDETFAFSDLADVVGGLPPSAYMYTEWWSNTLSNPQARGWLSAGRRVERVNLQAETVRFAASRPPAIRQPAPVAEPLEVEARGEAADLPGGVEVRIAGSWQRVGSVTTDGEGELQLPVTEPGPAIYRFVFVTAEGLASVYVGESVELRRRMRQYRKPSGNQQTSRRINALLRERLAAGDNVALEVLHHIRLDASKRPVPLDITSRASRVLIEHAALLELSAAGFTVHNL